MSRPDRRETKIKIFVVPISSRPDSSDNEQPATKLAEAPSDCDLTQIFYTAVRNILRP